MYHLVIGPQWLERVVKVLEFGIVTHCMSHGKRQQLVFAVLGAQSNIAFCVPCLLNFHKSLGERLLVFQCGSHVLHAPLNGWGRVILLLPLSIWLAFQAENDQLDGSQPAQRILLPRLQEISRRSQPCKVSEGFLSRG
jgi:hypothetical protein